MVGFHGQYKATRAHPPVSVYKGLGVRADAGQDEAAKLRAEVHGEWASRWDLLPKSKPDVTWSNMLSTVLPPKPSIATDLARLVRV